MRQALAAGRWEEANEVLGPAGRENPDSPEVASLREIIARHALERKVAAAEDALWLARRERRHDPAAAVARLEALDVDGLPQPLAGHLFGCWAEGWARLCRLRGLVDLLRYAPGPGRGAVLDRDGAGPHVVARSPFDGNWIYWATRMGRHPDVTPRVATLLKAQRGKCARCGLFFRDTDLLEIDHIVPRSKGGFDRYDNRQLLHRHCHDTKTATDGSLATSRRR